MRAIPSILLIDDNVEALDTIGKVLAAVGVKNVRETASAEEALEILKTQTFSLIVADYRLGGMDGVMFLEKLRASGDLTPVLLLSGAPDHDGVIRAASQPKVDFFGKPFRVADLVGAMDKLVSA